MIRDLYSRDSLRFAPALFLSFYLFLSSSPLPFLFAILFAEFVYEKFGHVIQGVGGFGQIVVIPEGVWQSFVDEQLRVDTRI